MTVGVLALQGAFAEHLAVFRRLGVATREVRLPGELDGLAALVIPGGESTAIGLLAREFGFLEPLTTFGRERALWGTCAGAILLSRPSEGGEGERLGLLDIVVRRNAFGRQLDSFQAPLRVPALDAGADPIPGPEPANPDSASRLAVRNPGSRPMIPPVSAPGVLPATPSVAGGGYDEPTPFPGIFIRAPLFQEVKGSSVEVLARLPDGGVVAVRQGRILATAFHPELTDDDRFHRYFLRLAGGEVPRP